LNKPLWTESLNNFIIKKHSIKGGASVWPYQVDLYSSKENLTWSEGFKNLMTEMILESDRMELTQKLLKLYNDLVYHNIKMRQKYNS
ncbi:hypothetical protein, partial [uncultured Tenacibaculum sp.]|uniref:hypothetical protein n=1 Tax=uncultured Tenacibaculum sp. TaxID=174713 RepID=UPI0026144A2B